MQWITYSHAGFETTDSGTRGSGSGLGIYNHLLLRVEAEATSLMQAFLQLISSIALTGPLNIDFWNCKSMFIIMYL